MFQLLQHVLSGQNQFASGGLLLMIIGGIGVYLRALPEQLWSWIVAQTTMMITVKDDDAAFQWVKQWFVEQDFLSRIRHVDVDTTLRGSKLALIPSPGRHWFWHAGRPFRVWFHRSEETKGWRLRRMESLTFRTIGRERAFLLQFVNQIVSCHEEKLRTASFLYIYDDGWTQVQAYAPRWLESVILRAGEKERLIRDLETFRASGQRYRRLGVPYHRGYLLYGPPGSGKTSLVSALAAKFGMSIYAVNLTELTDRTLKTAISEVPENSLILFEDIDCMEAGSRRPEDGRGAGEHTPDDRDNEKRVPAGPFGVTLSGLLNVLDGFHAPDNVVFVMTTNKVEKLDPALLRPGRIDYKLFLGEPAESQKIELYRRFFPEATETEAREFVQEHFVESMAEFQGLLLMLSEGGVTLASETCGICR